MAYVRTVKTGSGATAVQIVWSSRWGSRSIDERIQMESRMATFYPIREIENREELPAAIDLELRLAASSERPHLKLDLSGLSNIKRVLDAD